MSDFKPILLANFIDRDDGSSFTTIPVQNNLNLNLDMRQLADSFDFDLLYRRSESIDLQSHDFVEFYFKKEDGTKFQVSCGFIELLATDTSPNQHRFQANGRDFLGQLFNLPFLKAKAFDNTTMVNFIGLCIENSYLSDYLDLKGITRKVVDRGAYQGNVAIPELTDAKIGPVMQQTADGVYNSVYMNRFGQAVIYGRDNRLDYQTNLVLSEFNDPNVSSMSIRKDFSRVVSNAKVLYVGGENQVDYALQQSVEAYNSDPDAGNIFQPEVRTYNIPDLINTPGNNVLNNKMNQLAASIIRKGNQFIRQFVVKTNKPFYLSTDGTRTWYEKGQVYTIVNTSHNFNGPMMLVGIGYQQTESELNVQLLFVGVDTLT